MARRGQVIGAAAVGDDGRVEFTVRAEDETSGVVGDHGGVVPVDEFLSMGWATSAPIRRPGDQASILAS